MHFYDFNIGDYAKKTQHLTNEEDLAYRRALDMYYDTEKPLPIDNIPSLSRRLRVGLPALETVIAEFFPRGRNKHADEVIKQYYIFLDRQKANGRKGGRPKNQVVIEQENPTGNPRDSQNNPVPSQPLPTTQDPLPKNQGKSKTIAPLALLASLGIIDPIASDWITLRKTKKAAITETALKGIQREADKAGISLQDALQVCCERGWAGFKAEWMNGKSAGRDLEAERRAFVGEGEVIEGASKHVG